MGKLKKGILITLEGIEGCGKSTQLKKLSSYLRSKGFPVLETREPGGTLLGEKIRKFLLSQEHKNICGLTELFLYAASRAQHIEEIISPALEEKKIVLCDRFIDSTVVYQGFGRGIDLKLIKKLHHIKPELTFVLDLPVKEGLARVYRRKKVDRMESESIAFHETIRKGYHEIAKLEPERIKIISATGDKNQTFLLIKKQMDSLLDIK